MVQLNLSDATIERLGEVAAKRQQSVAEIVETLVAAHLDDLLEPVAATDPPNLENITAEMVAADPGLAEHFHAQGLMAPGEADPLEAFIGILDTDETNISETIRETLAEHTHPVYGWTLKNDRAD